MQSIRHGGLHPLKKRALFHLLPSSRAKNRYATSRAHNNLRLALLLQKVEKLTFADLFSSIHDILLYFLDPEL
jgi:hypothetical protein